MQRANRLLDTGYGLQNSFGKKRRSPGTSKDATQAMAGYSSTLKTIADNRLLSSSRSVHHPNSIEHATRPGHYGEDRRIAIWLQIIGFAFREQNVEIAEPRPGVRNGACRTVRARRFHQETVAHFNPVTQTMRVSLG
jgi:hypothetical protein